MFQSFHRLADTTGIELPERLGILLEIAQRHPKALGSIADFFWIDTQQAKHNPRHNEFATLREWMR